MRNPFARLARPAEPGPGPGPGPENLEPKTIERLRKLAEVLENFETERHLLRTPVTVSHFDLGVWAGHYCDERADRGCGFAACAIGTAMYHPWFQARGLGVYNNNPVYRDNDDDPDDARPLLEHWAAVEAFFDLSEDEATDLFSYDGYYDAMARNGRNYDVRPADVAAKIRAFIGDPPTTPLPVPNLAPEPDEVRV